MEQQAGARTSQRGKQRVRGALLSPQIIAIVGGTVLLVVVVMLGLTALERAAGIRTNDIAVSFILGALVTATVLVLVGVVTVYSGGVNWMTGGRAERWTDEVLRRLGPDWHIAHNLEFIVGDEPDTWVVDVDHVAVGPGGVLVVETKYSSDPVDLDAQRLKPQVPKAAEQVARNAQRVRGLFAGMDIPPPVIPLVIYWGFRVTTPEEPIRLVGRNQVVMGADADRWLCAFTEAKSVDPQVRREAWRRIQQHQTATTESI